jgi:hypothetical protein
MTERPQASPRKPNPPVRRLAAALGALGAAALLATACGGGVSFDSSSAQGTLKLALTDAPACGYEQVHVTIERVRFHRDAAAEAEDPGWAEIVLTPARRIDLLTLTNGVLEDLGQTPLPAGRYTQGRLVLAANGADAPTANALRLAGGIDAALTTPSAQRTGLKFDLDVEVQAGRVADIVLDFDACRSIVRRGQSGHYNLKPVLRVLPRLTDAGQRVIGFVTPTLATTQTQVSLQADGQIIKATPPDANGRFVLYPVPIGRYDLVLAAPGRALATITDVPVSAQADTYVNRSAAPLDPPAGAVRTLATRVQAASAGTLADIRVLRAYAGGPTVEVAGGPVDGDTGEYSVSLPTAAPLRAAYVPDGLGLAFTADTALPQAGYRVVARVGSTEQTRDVDLGALLVPELQFVFP